MNHIYNVYKEWEEKVENLDFKIFISSFKEMFEKKLLQYTTNKIGTLSGKHFLSRKEVLNVFYSVSKDFCNSLSQFPNLKATEKDKSDFFQVYEWLIKYSMSPYFEELYIIPILKSLLSIKGSNPVIIYAPNFSDFYLSFKDDLYPKHRSEDLLQFLSLYLVHKGEYNSRIENILTSDGTKGCKILNKEWVKPLLKEGNIPNIIFNKTKNIKLKLSTLLYLNSFKTSTPTTKLSSDSLRQIEMAISDIVYQYSSLQNCICEREIYDKNLDLILKSVFYLIEDTGKINNTVEYLFFVMGKEIEKHLPPEKIANVMDRLQNKIVFDTFTRGMGEELTSYLQSRNKKVMQQIL